MPQLSPILWSVSVFMCCLFYMSLMKLDVSFGELKDVIVSENVGVYLKW